MIDPAIFRNVLGYYPTGVCVVTAVTNEGQPVGMSIGSFTSVSLDPPLVAFFPNRRSTTWQQIREVGRFCVNILGDHQESISRHFATPAADKFAGIPHRTSSLGLPILEGVVAWIDCRLHSVHEAGDHSIAVGEVVELAIAERSAEPLVFHRGGYCQVNPMAAAA